MLPSHRLALCRIRSALCRAPDTSSAVESAFVPPPATTLATLVPVGALAARRRGLRLSMTMHTEVTVVSTAGVLSVGPIENKIHCR